MRFFPPHSDLNDAGIIFDKLADRFAAEPPRPGEFTDAIVLLEGCVLHSHGNLLKRRKISDGGSFLRGAVESMRR